MIGHIFLYFFISFDINNIHIILDSRKVWILNLFYHFYFLNMDISLNIEVSIIKFATGIDKNHMQGTLSQIYYLGLGFYFMANNG